MPNQSRKESCFATLIRWICFAFLLMGTRVQAQQSFTLEQVMSAPFPSDLTAAKSVPRIAWVLDEQGKRNIYVAEAPDFKARRLTAYLEEDGQEISSLQFSADANTIVYTRGGGKNRTGQSPNPTSNPAGAEEAVFQIAWHGGEPEKRGGGPQKIDAGHDARISNKGICAYVRDNQLWLAPLDGKEKPEQLVVRGTNSGQRWSPDGNKLAFVSARGDHSFIGIYDVNTKTVRFVAPSVDSDSHIEWSLDGKRIAFVRQPAVLRDTPVGHHGRRRRDVERKRNLAQRQGIAGFISLHGGRHWRRRVSLVCRQSNRVRERAGRLAASLQSACRGCWNCEIIDSRRLRSRAMGTQSNWADCSLQFELQRR
jgi:dipeptidyl aminopeptidase/acylaminoacyl peptidase